jgi:NADPH-dependent dioxygenase
MPRTKSVDLAIFGAGPVGLTAAHILADRGMDFLLFDREPGCHSHSYALALHPETLELMDRIGVVDTVLAQSLPLKRAAIMDSADGRQKALIDFNSLPTEYSQLAVVGQNKLETILVDALVRKGHRPLWRHQVRQIQPFSDRVVFAADQISGASRGLSASEGDLDVGQILDFEAQYVIGADGFDSTARKAAGIEFPEVAPGMDYAVFEFQTNVKALTEMRIMVDDDRTHIYWPLDDGSCRFSFQMPKGFAESASFQKTAQKEDPDAFEASGLGDAHLDHLLRTHAPWFIGSSKDVRWRVMVHFERRLASSFGEGRIWLAGDAAHMAAPAGMLSMNVGMLEAADLANKLSQDQSESGREFRLDAYALDRENEWHSLFDIDHAIYAQDAPAEWLIAHRSNLIGSLPASGKFLNEIFRQLHLGDTVGF